MYRVYYSLFSIMVIDLKKNKKWKYITCNMHITIIITIVMIDR